mgnify:CR=1 FL=1
MREFLGEGISDHQCKEYSEYSKHLRQIENSDFIARELQHHLSSITEYGIAICEELEGADLFAEMLNDHRRCAKLCEAEIERRKRRNKYPPRAGLVFRDYRAERKAIIDRTVEIIESYTPLKKRGKELVGHCIFHNDKNNPNLHVNESKKVWYCFACGIGGNVIDFVKRAEGAKAYAR